MRKPPEHYRQLQQRLLQAAKAQDVYELSTINLIAPATPTPYKYTNTSAYLQANPIAEGLLENRPYAGVEGFNEIESIAVTLAVSLFGAEHANVQPHSVSQANQAVYQALLDSGDKALAMDFKAGGHLTHGLQINFSGKFYDFDFYGVNDEGFIDYEKLSKQAQDIKPKLIMCGASSYPRQIDFERLRFIADQVGAFLVGDLSHPAGLIAADRFPQPFPYCHVVTLTPDKTMMGPHGGIILSQGDLAKHIDKAVHPGVQSSVPLHRILATALCLSDAGQQPFLDYIDRLLINMKCFESAFNAYPNSMITGGSDTHLMVLNTLDTFGLTGKDAETLLENIGILTNRQVIPNDQKKPYVASGLRLGAAWITGRGYTEQDSQEVADIILSALLNPEDNQRLNELNGRVQDMIYTPRKNDVWKKGENNG